MTVYDGPTHALVGTITPFGPAFTGGARVAVADITGDGVEDVVVAPGPGHEPVVAVYDGATLSLVKAFRAYAADFTGGLFVAAGDIDGTGRPDIVTGAGAAGGPHVKAFTAHDVMASSLTLDTTDLPADRSYFAYEPAFAGGVSVAVADLDADGHADIVTGAGPGGGPRVRAVSGRTGAVIKDFFAFDPADRAGVSVAAGDFGDGRGRVAATLQAAGPSVRVFDAAGNVDHEYRPFGAAGRPAAVVARDLLGTGADWLIVVDEPAAGANPAVKVLNGLTGDVGPAFGDLTEDYGGGIYVG